MSWSAISFDWNHARAFLATAEEGSLSAAARALGQTQPTLGRQVAALEDELGVTLFERVGRGLVLTPTGQSLRDHVAAMRDAAERVSLSATGQSDAIEGTVAITASDVASVVFLPPILDELRRIAPKLVINVVADNTLRDIQRREADIAIRHVRPQEPELIARLIGEGSAHFVAASSYIQARGRPETYEDLGGAHEFVAFGEPTEFLGYLTAMGVPARIDQFRIQSDNGLVAWEMVKRGMGITIMDDKIAAHTPGIERLIPDADAVHFPIWLTTHRELHTSKKIRLVFDVLADMLPKVALV
ncbi:MAG: LysR family transcriptional regulator [Pseudomonadota bacterium]